MNTVGLDGSEHKLTFNGLTSKSSLNNKSSLHLEARTILKEAYPTLQIIEEVPVYIRKSEIMYIDFFIPLIRKCIEVHGEQHYEFIPFYHRSRMDFFKQQKRDKDKAEWCHMNNLTYIELPYNKQHEWSGIIKNA
jgi:hypothetical protein